MMVHPGLADPETLSRTEQGLHPGLNQTALGDLYDSLMDVEDPLYDQLLSLIGDVTRPEMSAEDTVEDLILLAKQGATLEGMRRSLSRRIICYPSGEMMEALRNLHDGIPRWFTLNMDRVQ